MEKEVIADIARRVQKTGRYTETAEIMAKSMREQGFSTAKIQSEVLKLLRADKDYKLTVAENTKAYKQMVTNAIKDTVHRAKMAGDKLIARAGMMAFNNDLSMWELQGVDLKKPNSMSQLLDAFSKQTNRELRNLTRTLGFRNTVLGTTCVMDMYQKELDLAVLKVATGTFSYDQAVNDCVKRLAQSGLRSVDYENGRSYQLDTAARMTVRTAVSQLSGKIMEENLKSTGQDLVITSQHAGSRPEHVPWQNKVFSYSGKSKKYPNFFKETGYGTAGGLKGVNCTHDFYPFWEGASVIPEDIEWSEEYYKNTQKQRSMERDIRALKRELEAQKAIGGDTAVLQAKLRQKTAEYRSFSEQVGIRIKDNRLTVASGTSDLKKTKAWKNAFGDEQQGDVKELARGIINKVNDHAPIGISELPKTQVTHINMMIDSAPQLVKEFTLSKIDDVKIINEKYLGRPYTTKKGIRFNLKEQIHDKRGSYTAFFHEVGHSLDEAYGDVSVLHVFKISLQNDFSDVVNSYCKYYNISRDEAFAEISKSLKDNKLHSVSDLCGGLSDNKCVGLYRHKTEYWKNTTNALEKEAFAHFYEATIRNDADKLNAIKQMFPSAYKLFEDMLR